MTDKQQKSILKSLQGAGYIAEKIKLVNPERCGVKIDTDYSGPYPSREQFDTLHEIRRKYSKKHIVEPRGHYSAIFIY